MSQFYTWLSTSQQPFWYLHSEIAKATDTLALTHIPNNNNLTINTVGDTRSVEVDHEDIFSLHYHLLVLLAMYAGAAYKQVHNKPLKTLLCAWGLLKI